jgi:hypothetical protein
VMGHRSSRKIKKGETSEKRGLQVWMSLGRATRTKQYGSARRGTRHRWSNEGPKGAESSQSEGKAGKKSLK